LLNSLSVIIPFYNGESFFEKLIGSLFNAMEPVDKRFTFELIVIIDSCETSIEYVHEVVDSCFFEKTNIDVQVIKNSVNLGVAKSRNLGLSRASGDLVHLIDQDDTVSPAFYSSVLANAEKYNFVLVNGRVYYDNKKYMDHKLYYLKQRLTLRNLVRNDFIRSPGQVVFSKELIIETRFPEPFNYHGADDRFFWFNIFFKNESYVRPLYLHDVLYNAFIHNDNFSLDQVNLRKSTLENWEIFLKQNEPSEKLRRLINKDILSLRFSAQIKQTLIDCLVGMFYRVLYFFDANRMIRYVIKRFTPSHK
jgi:glycosyltransferase involved in cell wall biosynthesis